MLTTTYATAAADTVDVYPAAAPNSPIIIAIHGGGWTKGDKSVMANLCTTGVAKGYACFSINYSLAPGSHWPTQLTEMGEALAWVQAHAADYNGDPNRIAAWGVSAGAHLALSMAYRVPGVKAVVDWSGPTDLVNWFPYPAQQLLGCPASGCPGPQADASPIDFAAPSSPPTYIAHSTGDLTVVFWQSAALDSRLNALGVNHVFQQVAGTQHALALWNVASAPTFTWLAAHL